MPIWKFRSAEEAARALPASPDADTGVRTALALSALDGARRLGIRTSQRGVFKYSSVAEAEADREAFALARLREHADPAA